MPKIDDGFWSQTPGDHKDYAFDFSQWLVESTPPDTITSANLIVSDPLLIATIATIATTAVIIWVSGGLPGVTYTIECRIGTTGARIETPSIKILVQEPLP